MIALISDHGWDTLGTLGVLAIVGLFSWLIIRGI